MTNFLRVVTPAEQTPVSVDELRQQLVLSADSPETNGYLHSLISLSTEEAERYTARALVTQTLKYTLAQFVQPVRYDETAGTRITLPRRPVQSITSITYLDDDAVRQTVASDVYELYGDDDNAHIRLAHGKSWPSALVLPNSIEIIFVAGYASIEAIPQTIKHAILVRCGDRIEHRESVLVGVSANKIRPNVFEYMLDSYRGIG